MIQNFNGDVHFDIIKLVKMQGGRLNQHICISKYVRLFLELELWILVFNLNELVQNAFNRCFSVVTCS